MPPDKEKAPPGGSGASSKFIAAVNSDGSDHTVDLPVLQLLRRPVRPNELPELRSIYWHQAALGHRLPAEIGVIVLDGGDFPKVI